MPSFPQPREPTPLTWEITDLSQTVLARLDSRKAGASITIPLNAGRRATVQLDTSDPALGAVVTTAGLPVLDKVLRVRLEGQDDPLFCGRIFAPEVKAGGSDRTVTLNALDPWAQLDRDIIQEITTKPNGVDLVQYKQFGPEDQSSMIQEVCGYGGINHGIYAPNGTLAAPSVTRTRSYAVGTTLGQVVTELANLNLGVDVDLVPLTDPVHAPTALAQLYTYYPKRGIDKSASVVFEYGHGRQSATAYTTSPAGEDACNYMLVTGTPPGQNGDYRIAYIAQHAASIAQYGILAKYEDRSDTSDITTLRDYAVGQVGQLHDPTAFFTLTQAPTTAPLPPTPTGDGYGTPPSFGPDADYYLGDTVALRVQPDSSNDPADQVTFIGRVTDATITELATGQIQVQVDCGPEIDTSGVTATRATAYLPDLSQL